MIKNLEYLSASDSDIFDILLSSKQRITDTVLHNLARDRGIFYSPHESREELAARISQLPHDFHDLETIVSRREPLHKRERATSVRLNDKISKDELRLAAEQYITAVGNTENVVHRPTENGYKIVVGYDEYNHSRARLLQRERHEAVIEVIHQDGETLFRCPATEKAKRIVATIKRNIERERTQAIPIESIELTGLPSPELRLQFFIRLISTMKGFKLTDVMNLRFTSRDSDLIDAEYDLDLDVSDTPEDDRQNAIDEIIGTVHSMALSGQNLVRSKEYIELTRKGFYITSISWRAERDATDNDIYQFDAGFEDRKLGSGFKYSVQGVFRKYKDRHRKTITHVDGLEKTDLLSLIEDTARVILRDLRSADVESEHADSEA
ncbi:hypothetical protein AZL_d03800 (plasmid) [Azospirillum sp. B510]|uniref:hypothetical protein n=1 Tax=Azospirillum sp. (strain B510) TaxID=137722 RepID=UPI0001C4C90B|nr:hypothetical protein [Azospirillum sp. B510]BAI76206.1 hypothetical protein AZL_d03800 [Azospirillum sp. B510]